MRVEAGAGGGAAERDLADAAERRLDPLHGEPHLRRVAAELLAEGHGHRVHQVRAARLDDVLELGRLRFQRALQRAHRGQQVMGDLVERRQVHRAGEDVVGRLAHVHVVVRVRAVAREVRDHLVGVHVRRGARAGLEDVDRELVVVLALGDRGAGGGDPLVDSSPSSLPSAPLASAAADLIRPSQRTTGTGTRSPETGKLSTALVVSPPQSCSPAVVSASTLKVRPPSSLMGSIEAYWARRAGSGEARAGVIAARRRRLGALRPRRSRTGRRASPAPNSVTQRIARPARRGPSGPAAAPDRGSWQRLISHLLLIGQGVRLVSSATHRPEISTPI